MVRVGRYGPYLQRGEDRASIPEDLAPDELTIERAEELLERARRATGSSAPTPRPALPVYVKAGRFGPYVQLGEVVDGAAEAAHGVALRHDVARPRSPSRGAPAAARSPGSSAPIPTTGEEIVAHNGRFGPYLKRGTDTRSLTSEEQLLTVDPRRGAGASSPSPRPAAAGRPPAPLRELGADPETGLPGRAARRAGSAPT